MNLSRPAVSSERAHACRPERHGVAARLLGGVLLLSGLVTSSGQVGPPTLANDFRNVFSAVPRSGTVNQSVTISATATTTLTPTSGTWRTGVAVNGANTDVGSLVLSTGGRSAGDVLELDLAWSASPANAAVKVLDATIGGTVLLNVAAPGYPGTSRIEFFRFSGTAWTRVLWPPRAPDLSSPTLGQFQNGSAFGGWLARGTTAVAGVTTLKYPQTPNYPAVPGPGTIVAGALRLESVRLYRPMVLSVPSYSYGQEIPGPLTDSFGNPVAAGFYLREPVHSLITSTVTSTITAAGVAATSAPVYALAAAKANPGLSSTTTTDASGTRTVVTIITTYGDLATGPDPFYYSPHALKVFATQPGTIAITWKEAGSGNTRNLTYLIASSPVKTPRKIYWTENGFNGPRVQVPAARVNLVNIVYNSLFPQTVPEAESYKQPNQNPLIPVETKTLWYDAQQKIISAYNREGRAFVEYLGNQKSDGLTRIPLDYEIVEVVKEVGPSPQSVQLGDVAGPPDGDSRLQASIAAGNGANGVGSFVYDQISLSGTKHTLYAVRQTTPQAAGFLSNEVLIYWEEADPLQVYWPKYYSGYVQAWPPIPAELAKYSVYARPDQSLGDSTASGVQLNSQNNPSLVYQDDPNNSQAVLTAQNVFYTNITTTGPTNRALLRYSNGDDIWFERVYSRLDNSFQGFGGGQTLSGLLDASGNFATGYQNLSGVTVKDQNGTLLVLGADYTINLATGTITAIGNTISGSITVSFNTASSIVMADIGARILPDKVTVAATLEVSSQTFATGYTDISEVVVTNPANGHLAILNTDYTLDTVRGKIVRKASGSLGTSVSISLRPYYVGYVRQARGTAFSADAYLDPFVSGFDVATQGAIIGVNNLPGNDLLEVWWFTKSKPPGSKLTGTYWPSSVQTYQLRWPLTPPQIVLASNAGSGPLSSLQAAGQIYTQNDSTTVGFNPNEEHALMANGRAWALRDDLNLATTSKPYVLVAYTETDQRPAMTVFKVLREDATNLFNYPGIAGVVLQAPMPLPLLAPPLNADGSLASYEFQQSPVDPPVGTFAPTGADANFAQYEKFTWTDRTGTVWLYRGPHAGNANTKTFRMRYFYSTQPGFFFPSKPAQDVGTITPYLRNLDATSPDGYKGDPVTGAVSGEAVPHPLDVVFTPQWPASVPELRVSQTLTAATLGLPAVRGQTSAELIYQQSIALDNSGKPNLASRQQSARLYDPTVAKKYAFDPPGSAGKIGSIPDSVNTSSYLGKTYFPGLPPHLSLRLFFDPAEGANGSMVFQGQYVNVGTGDPYLLLNVMSAAEVAAAKGLCTEVGTVKTNWDAAIDGLAVTMNTYVENPFKRGTYIVDTDEVAAARFFFDLAGNKVTIPPGLGPPITPRSIGLTELPEIFYGDTAKDSYAVGASGGGQGYVVLATGNGRAFTPVGEPVSLQVFKVSPPLHRGEVKVINSANPLDEKLTLQHSGDFAGHPEDYDFEWRYAPPVNGSPPLLYSLGGGTLVGDSNTNAATFWSVIHDPGTDYSKFRNSDADVTTFASVALPATQVVINDGSGTADNGSTLPNAVLRRTFAASTRPLQLFVSLSLGTNDGAIVYLNGTEAAVWNAPNRVNSTLASKPATSPALVPLPLLFEVNTGALLAAPGGATNTLTVQLYTSADVGTKSTIDARLEAVTATENLIAWLPTGLQKDALGNLETKSTDTGSTVNPAVVAIAGKNRYVIQGTSILTLSDNWFIMRYRAREKTLAGVTIDPANATLDNSGGWSTWTSPQLAEGWIKRALAGINPFQQRLKDLFNNAVNTNVSLVEQAGKRWEGDIPLSLANINDFGLIEIYETILRRGESLSINGNPGINYDGANDALLLAAGYLNDLYMILGNEAYADAANPTIAFNTDSAANFITQYGDVATSLFAFKGETASVLEEELALLRGRDDFLSPGSRTAPVYNRLYWNYTRGIDSGEAIYALNYNIKDVAWDYFLQSGNPSNLPNDGIISAADAAKLYPQGHGDAYGHYLTALTGYYGLLTNTNFSWTPRIEAVLVLGTPVNVDYFDERKFAKAALAEAQAASQIVDLTYREAFTASDNAGWAAFQDGRANTSTGVVRHWGVDEWASRAGQGAYFHWVTGNSLLPAVDPDPSHSGIQKIDRTTVPELASIIDQATAIQQSLDNADAHLNPLGLATGALSFDISPADVDAGKTHFEQIYGRALIALQNAVSAFNNAKGSTQFLRQQEDSLDAQVNAIAQQEQAFTNQLIELYGTPYTDDIGPGKTYVQGYTGPDLLHSMYIDYSSELLPANAGSPTPTSNMTYSLYDGLSLNDVDPVTHLLKSSKITNGDTVTYTLGALGDAVKPADWTGQRVSPGKIQAAEARYQSARANLYVELQNYNGLLGNAQTLVALYQSAVTARNQTLALEITDNVQQTLVGALQVALNAGARAADFAVSFAADSGGTARDSLPKSVGTANDVFFAARATLATPILVGELFAGVLANVLSTASEAATEASAAVSRSLAIGMGAAAWTDQNNQLLNDLQGAVAALDTRGAVNAAAESYAQAARDLRTLRAEGDRIQQARLIFRQNSAALIQGYRTRDFAFRAFRDEALERYKSLFDLAALYTYLAARSYDYETGLLDASGSAKAATCYKQIVQARALGVVTNGQPQFAGASTGDPGLSGVLAAMSSDWSVVKTRLGFNNPSRYNTTFSLRGEKFRILPGTEGDQNWQTVLASGKTTNILDDPDVKRYCMHVGDANGLPVPGFVIPFQTTISDGFNYFGVPLASGDHTFTPSTFATKIRSSGVAFSGYIGMDAPTTTSGTLAGIGATAPAATNTSFTDPKGLSATPYIYLIPAGADSMLAPPLGDTSSVRTWQVEDQAIPLPFNIGNSSYSTQPAWVSAASLSEAPFTIRKHSAFRAVPDGTNFPGGVGFTNSRLIGRSVWNSQWKIVIPGNTLLNDPAKGVQIFLDTVKDIKLHLETYSYSGN